MTTGKSKATDGALDVRVKPLEWIERVGVTDTFDAKTSIGNYIAAVTDDGMAFWFLVGQTRSNYCDTLEAAKSAAQDDFDTRIRSSLAALPPPTGAPVAYAYVVDGECEEIGWGAPPIDDPSTIWLYAAPPQVEPAEGEAKPFMYAVIEKTTGRPVLDEFCVASNVDELTDCWPYDEVVPVYLHPPVDPPSTQRTTMGTLELRRLIDALDLELPIYDVDGRDMPIMAQARSALLDPENGVEVGKASSMPGASGFTMVCFQADDVPVGTKLYKLVSPKA